MQTWIIALVLVAFTAGCASAPAATPAERVTQLLEDPTLLKGTRDTLELLLNRSVMCRQAVQQLVATGLDDVSKAKFTAGQSLTYAFNAKHMTCLQRPWANELFPELGDVHHILREFSLALCAQNYTVRCDVNVIKPAGEADADPPQTLYEHIDVHIELPPVPDLAKLKAMTSENAIKTPRKATSTCQCP